MASKICFIGMFLAILMFSGSVLAQTGDTVDEPVSGTQTQEVVQQPGTMGTESGCGCNYDGVCDESECSDCKDCMNYLSAIIENAVQKTTTRPSVKMVYAVDDSLMRELDSLMLRLKEAEMSGDSSLAEKMRSRIREVRDRIDSSSGASGESGSGSGGEAYTPAKEAMQVDKCAELKNWEVKRDFYLGLKELTDEELRAKGYSGREEIEATIEKLEDGMERIRRECTGSSTPESGGFGETQATVERPVVATNAGEIGNYYRIRIESIMSDAENLDEKIENLKDLRNDVDNLISELIKSRDSFNASDVSGFVESVQVTPGRIVAGNVGVNALGKRIYTNLNDREIEISPSESHVVIREEGVEVNASDVKIEKGKMTVGSSEVKVNPSQARSMAAKVVRSVRNMELKSEEGRAVYSVEGQEDRNLLGFIPVRMDKRVTIDAASAEQISEEAPWWSFMAF